MALDIAKVFDWTFWNPLDPIQHGQRVPMKIWTDQSQGKILELAVNPRSVRFSQPKRITDTQVKEGRVYFFWSTGPGEKNLDVLTLTVTGTSGSILNRVAFKEYSQKVGQEKVKNPPQGAINTKHRKWMQLYAMTREPVYPDELEGDFNYAYIEYVSPLFPQGKQITFKGHFSNPLEFDEEATRPFLIDYSFEFIVHQTTPDIDSILQQANNVLVEK